MAEIQNDHHPSWFLMAHEEFIDSYLSQVQTTTGLTSNFKPVTKHNLDLGLNKSFWPNPIQDDLM